MIRLLCLWKVLAVLVVVLVAVDARAAGVKIATYRGGHGEWIVDLDDIDDWDYVPEYIPFLDQFLFPDNTLEDFFIVYTGTGSNGYLRLYNPLLLPIEVSELHVRATDTLEIDRSTLQVGLPGLVDNAGTILLKDGTLATGLFPQDRLLTIEGGGTIQMQGDAAIGGLLEVVSIKHQSIFGEGTITGLMVDLDATIDANILGKTLDITFTVSGENDGNLYASNGGKLEIGAVVGKLVSFSNDGLMQARQSGVLELRDMSFDNDGIIQAISNGFVQFKNINIDNGGVIDVQHGQATLRGDVVIKGGTIQTGPNGWVVIAEKTNDFMNGMTLRGNFRIDPGAVLDLEPGSYDAQDAVFEIHNQMNLHNATVTGAVFSGPGRAYVRASSTLVRATIDGGHVFLPGSYSSSPHVLALVDRLTMNNGGILTIEDQSVGLGTSDAELRIDGPVTIDGSDGAIRFGAVGHSGHVNIIRAVNDGHLTISQNIRIEAPGGRVGYVDAPVTNYGSIDANGGQIYLRATTLTNRGIIGTNEGGTIHLQNGVTIDNVGGQITAGAGTTLQYNNATIIGGTLNGPGTHRNASRTVHFNGTNHPVTIDEGATYLVPGNTRLTISGELINNGTIFMSDHVLGIDTINAELLANGPATISGTGTILFDYRSHSINNHEFVGYEGSSFTFGPDLLLTDKPGAAGMARFQIPIFNYGTIQTYGGDISFIHKEVTNRGIIRSLNGGKLQFGLANEQQIIDNIDGVLYVDPTSQITLSGTFIGATVRGGTIAGGGEVVITPRGILDGTVQRITIQDATVRLTGNTGLRNNAGEIYGEIHLDNGGIALRSPGGYGHDNVLYLMGDNPRITGVGTIFFEPAFGRDNTIVSNVPFTVEPGITMGSIDGGYGQIRIANITNQGVLQAHGGSVTVQAQTIDNTGTFRAAAGGTLVLADTNTLAPITINSAGGGQFLAEPNSTILVGWQTNISGAGVYANIYGGTFTGGGNIQLATTTNLYSTPENPITIGPATLLMRGSTRTYFNGTFIMEGGRILIHDSLITFGSFDPVIYARGETHLIGNGSIEFGPSSHNYNHYLGAESVTDENGESRPGSWNLGPGITITAPSGAMGTIIGTVNTHGILHSNGQIYIDGGTTTVYDDGMVTGAGTISVRNGATLINHGTTSPGNSPGTLTIAGHYTHTDTSRLVIEIAGTAPGMYDVLKVNGRFTAAGTLEIVLLDGFRPDPDDVFTFLTTTQGFIGGFDNVLINGGIISTLGGSFTLTQVGNTLTLSNFVAEPLPEPAAIIVMLAGGTLLLQRRER